MFLQAKFGKLGKEELEPATMAAIEAAKVRAVLWPFRAHACAAFSIVKA